MTTNLKIRTNRKQKVILAPVTGTDNSTLTIELSHNLQAWNNGRAADINGFYNLNTEGFHVDNDPTHDIIGTKIERVEITGPTPILTTFRNLIFLKNEVKGIGNNAQGEFNFELVIDKDIDNQADRWTITAESSPGANDRILQLSVADFGGRLDASKISIDDTEYHAEANNVINILENRQSQKQELLDLEKLLNETLPNKYRVVLDFNHEPDVNLTDPSADLLKLEAYQTATNPIKGILFNLKDNDNYNSEIYRIDEWINDLKLINLLLKYGLTTKSQFTLLIKTHDGRKNYQWGDLTELDKEPGLYKGFPILDPNLRTVVNPVDNEFEVEVIDPDKPVRYTKENIDNFREFAAGYNGSDSDIFAKKKTIQNAEGNGIQVFANRKPEECLGFQPGDVYRGTTNNCYYNSGRPFRGVSKIAEDIWAAQNAEEAMDLAFFGKDYNEPLSLMMPRKGNPVAAHLQKNPNVNLQFNEIVGWSRLNTLEYYYQALQKSASCCWVIPDGTAGVVGAKPAPKYDDPDTKKKIDDGYQLAGEFITDYERWIGANFANLDKTQLTAEKAKLEKWKNTRFYTSGGVWKSVIDNFLIEVNNALAHLDDNDNPPPPTYDWKVELAGLKNRASELAKKIYQNCQPDQDGFTEAAFNELKKLVKLLEEAHGTKTANTKSELTTFIADSENDADKKKALEIAKKVKNQDSDSKDCVEAAREKLKEPQEVKLEAARQRLKNLLAGLKIGTKDAYEEVVADIKDSEVNINQAIEIFEKCREIEAATNDDEGKLVNVLNNFKNDASHKEAWEAINKIKKDGQGYAEVMLKKLNDWAEQRKKDYQDIKNAKTLAEFQKAKTKFIKKPEYQNNKQDYDQIYFPLAELAAQIREKGTNASQSEKDLVELIIIKVSDYGDWKTQLTDLEGKLNKLKEYVEGGEKHAAIQNYSTIQKEGLKKLISKMEAKVKEWKAEKAKSESSNSSPSQENPSWYETPLGIIGIIVAIVLIGGVIYYFVKQNISRED